MIEFNQQQEQKNPRDIYFLSISFFKILDVCVDQSVDLNALIKSIKILRVIKFISRIKKANSPFYN